MTHLPDPLAFNKGRAPESADVARPLAKEEDKEQQENEEEKEEEKEEENEEEKDERGSLMSQRQTTTINDQ